MFRLREFLYEKNFVNPTFSNKDLIFDNNKVTSFVKIPCKF